MNNSKQIVLLLDNIRSVLNVGAIFRTADAVGVARIYLGGYTPAPIDRFGRKRNDFHKSALGAEEAVLWESVDQMEDCVDVLKKEGFHIVSLEQGISSVDYKKYPTPDKVCIIIGNEVSGVAKKLQEKSDGIVSIPMFGEKESLNVSVATGILLFRWFDI